MFDVVLASFEVVVYRSFVIMKAIGPNMRFLGLKKINDDFYVVYTP